MSDQPIFDALRAILGRGIKPDEFRRMKAAIAEAGRQQEPRRISAAGLDLIKRSEGLRLNAYRCPADVPTIGYGSTGPHVRMGTTITEAEAEDLLTKDLARFEAGVSEIGGEMTQGQFDALTSFAFNVGFGDPKRNIPGLKTSTLLRKHLAGDHDGAAAEFARWNRGGGKVLAGLVTRRAAEAKLYRGDA